MLGMSAKWQQHAHLMFGPGTCARELRSVIAAKMELEEACLQQVAMLMHEQELWRTLPERALTVRHRCLVFRMLSMLGCCLEELLRKQHRALPTKLFRLLDLSDARIAAELRRTPICCQDDFSKGFLGKHEGLRSPEASAILAVLAAVLKYDIVQIENRHVSIRRWLNAMSSHTQPAYFEKLSKEWVAQRARLHRLWKVARVSVKTSFWAHKATEEADGAASAQVVAALAGRAYRGPSGAEVCR